MIDTCISCTLCNLLTMCIRLSWVKIMKHMILTISLRHKHDRGIINCAIYTAQMQHKHRHFYGRTARILCTSISIPSLPGSEIFTARVPVQNILIRSGLTGPYLIHTRHMQIEDFTCGTRLNICLL